MIEDLKIVIVKESLFASILSDAISVGSVCAMAVINHLYLGSSWVIDLFAVTLFFFLIGLRSSKKVKEMTPKQAHEYLDKLLRARKGEAIE